MSECAEAVGAVDLEETLDRRSKSRPSSRHFHAQASPAGSEGLSRLWPLPTQ